MNTKEYQTYSSQNNQNICEPIADYCRVSRESMGSLFEDIVSDVTESDIRVVELFAGFLIAILMGTDVISPGFLCFPKQTDAPGRDFLSATSP